MDWLIWARERHQARLQSDEELQDMLAEIDAFEEQVDRKTVSPGRKAFGVKKWRKAEARRSNLYAHATGWQQRRS